MSNFINNTINIIWNNNSIGLYVSSHYFGQSKRMKMCSDSEMEKFLYWVGINWHNISEVRVNNMDLNS